MCAQVTGCRSAPLVVHACTSHHQSADALWLVVSGVQVCILEICLPAGVWSLDYLEYCLPHSKKDGTLLQTHH